MNRRGPLESILGLVARAARGTIRSWIRGTLEHTAKPALRWVLAMEISYLIAAGLAITAAAFLLSALASGLVELGLPPWAAQLILGAVAAVAAFVYYKRGRNKRLRDEFDEEADDEPPRGWRVRIVKGAERRPRPHGGTFDVHPSPEGWEVTSRSPRVKESFETKEQALRAARRRASKADQARVVVHGSSGAIQDILRYGNER